ncbi:MAG TPA: nicotinate-nucleotide adenylyltransferase [Candidatus Methanoperedens sp.]|nr:nicotinate-nucleotide adenylyltransferase [Candidatus Methanoperedens sp.]
MNVAARIGVYGGTFNPIHLAHLVLAEEVRERLGLDRVLFVPSNLPPHKGNALPTGAERLALVRLAIRGNPGFGAVDLELRRGGRSYTIDTLRALAGRRPGERELYFLIGMDAFAEIRTWHEADRLAEAAHFAVFPRAGHPLEDPRRHAPAAWRLGAPRRLAGGLRAWRTAAGTSVWLVPTEELSLSASAIRARAARGASIRYLVPAAVERAIHRLGLYRRGTKRGRAGAPRHTKGA